MYPPIAKAAHVTGTVVVRVTVKDGLMIQTDVLFKPAVASARRLLESLMPDNPKTWRFAADVTGAFTVAYAHEISGTDTEEPTNANVEMLPSLDVKITARSVKPNVMYQKQSSPAADTSSCYPSDQRLLGTVFVNLEKSSRCDGDQPRVFASIPGHNT